MIYLCPRLDLVTIVDLQWNLELECCLYKRMEGLPISVLQNVITIQNLVENLEGSPGPPEADMSKQAKCPKILNLLPQQ